MITIPHRRTLEVLVLSLIFMAGVVYDTLAIQTKNRTQLLLVACVALGFGTLLILQRYPRVVLQPVLVAAWPLHVYTLAFVAVCVVFHGGAKLDQVIVYSLLAYATYVLVPLIFLLDYRLFQSAVAFLALMSAALAIPSFVGAVGIDNFLGLPLRNKATYANWSGIIASGGIFEHAEGHAYQMAIGVFCAWYALRTTGNLMYSVCLVFSLVGLVISQGRAAILGVVIACGVMVLPQVFRRSRLLFVATLLTAIAFPFLIISTLAAIPGISGYLRVQRGLSGRDEAWKYAATVIEDKPWTGHGFMASSELTEAEKKTLRKAGFSGAGTTFHNTFVTKAVDLGLVVTGIYLLMYLVPLARICRPSGHPTEEWLVRSMLVLVVTASIFRDYNIGGIRSTAMIGTIFLGLGNLWGLEPLWGADWMGEADVGDTLPEAEGEMTSQSPLACSDAS